MPFFSTDSRWVGFFAKGKLKKITVGGTGLQDLADAADPRGGAWAADNSIYFAPTTISRLMKVQASGGPPVAATEIDRQAGEVSHRWPRVVDDGRALIFAVWTGPGIDEHRLEQLSLGDGRRTVVVRGVDGPSLVAGGFLLVAGRSDSVMALPWSPGQTSLNGVEPLVVPLRARNDSEGVAAMALSNDGAVAYLQGRDKGSSAQVVWVDRGGAIDPLPVPARDYAAAATSPDGKRAVIQIQAGVHELWMYEFSTESLTPFVTTGGSSQSPVWTSDGKAVLYRGTRTGFRNVFRKPVAGGDEVRLTTGADVVQTPTSVSRDGRWVIFNQSGSSAAGGTDIMALPLDGSGEAKPVIATPASENNGQISPDGRWVAYESTVSGRQEVWMAPFMTPGSPHQVSRAGAMAPRWSNDGRELFFLGEAGVMAASVNGENVSQPRQLFAGRFVRPQNASSNYAVAPDGRFLLGQPVEPDQPVTRIEIVLNVLAGIRK
jgi:dipeptidyl aminopeptidase/acylaminoacyl peptidase